MSVDVTKQHAGKSLGACRNCGDAVYEAILTKQMCTDGMVEFVKLVHYYTADAAGSEPIGFGCVITSRDDSDVWPWAKAMAMGKPATALARLQAWLDESIHRDAKIFRQDRCPDGARVWTVRLDDHDRPGAPWSAALEESLDEAIDAALKVATDGA